MNSDNKKHTSELLTVRPNLNPARLTFSHWSDIELVTAAVYVTLISQETLNVRKKWLFDVLDVA